MQLHFNIVQIRQNNRQHHSPLLPYNVAWNASSIPLLSPSPWSSSSLLSVQREALSLLQPSPPIPANDWLIRSFWGFSRLLLMLFVLSLSLSLALFSLSLGFFPLFNFSKRNLNAPDCILNIKIFPFSPFPHKNYHRRLLLVWSSLILASPKRIYIFLSSRAQVDRIES